jgi:hypothetical protein
LDKKNKASKARDLPNEPEKSTNNRNAPDRKGKKGPLLTNKSYTVGSE